MQIRFLDISFDGIFLLGYRLSLSSSEEKILRAVAEGGKSGAKDLASLLPQGVSEGNIAVHISSINKKAKRLSQRRLIICEGGRYKINPLM